MARERQRPQSDLRCRRRYPAARRACGDRGGAGLAALYYGIAEVLGPDYIRYAGNNERYFPLFLGVILLSWIAAIRAWAALDPDRPPPPV